MLDWDDLRYALALVRAGSLARAAKELDVDHTTVGRRIESLERALAVRLFVRTTGGYVLTAEGEALLPKLECVEDAVHAAARGAAARDERVAGRVRITAGEVFASRYLAPRLASLQLRHPELLLELVTGVRRFDLARREADIAVRFFRTEYDYLVIRKAGEVGFSLYASEAYLGASPPLRGPGDLAAHRLLGDDVEGGILAKEDAWLEKLAQDAGARVVFRSNSTNTLLGAALAGAGIVLLPRFLGDGEPTLRRIAMPDEPTRDVWLTIHKDLQHAPRIRAVLDHLAEVLRADEARLVGCAPSSAPSPRPKRRAR